MVIFHRVSLPDAKSYKLPFNHHFPLAFLWVLSPFDGYVSLMTYLITISYGLPMVSPPFSHGFPLRISQNISGSSTIFLWVSQVGWFHGNHGLPGPCCSPDRRGRKLSSATRPHGPCRCQGGLMGLDMESGGGKLGLHVVKTIL